MKTWEELVTGDELTFVILGKDNITELLDNRLAVGRALILWVEHINSTYIIHVECSIFDQIITTIPEYFTETGSIVEWQECVLIIGTDQEAFTHHLKTFLNISY